MTKELLTKEPSLTLASIRFYGYEISKLKV